MENKLIKKVARAIGKAVNKGWAYDRMPHDVAIIAAQAAIEASGAAHIHKLVEALKIIERMAIKQTSSKDKNWKLYELIAAQAQQALASLPPELRGE